jgi:putative flavoprotein involved in K+ transport
MHDSAGTQAATYRQGGPRAALIGHDQEAAMSRRRQAVIDCAVVGAGAAGLPASAALTARGIEHVVLERGRIGESWRTQRWDSFRLNTPGWMNQLLGQQAPDSYATGVEVIRRLEKLAADCPVREGVRVARLAAAGNGCALRIDGGDILARTVVVATGDQNLPMVPARAGTFPDRIAHYHTAHYRGRQRPVGLPDHR